MSKRDTLARCALDEIPKLLTLQDRNPHSPTYGCFDRNFWHYKTIDFPSGMAQEFVWPLALAYRAGLTDNPYRESAAIRDWGEAGIRYAARSARSDGSCDDYYPYEQATGAAGFSLLACVEAYLELGLEAGELLEFFRRRADWLAGHRESGRLSNHEALVILCLVRVAELLGTDRWRSAIDDRLARLLSWQHPEGWFIEYEGCDPGYHTLTLSLLARIEQLSPRAGIREALTRAVGVAAEFIHPDGSFGGEYGSRNTLSFFPHGFEIVGRWMPDALAINDLFLQALQRGLIPRYTDDRIIGHHLWNYLLAARDFIAERPGPLPRAAGRRHFADAGLLIDRRAGFELYLALNKGGTFKLFHHGRLLASDTQISFLVEDRGGRRNAVGHLSGEHRSEIADDHISVTGTLSWVTHPQMTTVKLIALRLIMIGIGRVLPNLIRKALQKLLITGKTRAPFQFCREFVWEGQCWIVRDEVRCAFWNKVVSGGVGGSQTSIYVAMSRVYQSGQLQPWIDLTEAVKRLGPSEPLRLERRFCA
jgi:hypothetical protein